RDGVRDQQRALAEERFGEQPQLRRRVLFEEAGFAEHRTQCPELSFVALLRRLELSLPALERPLHLGDLVAMGTVFSQVRAVRARGLADEFGRASWRER